MKKNFFLALGVAVSAVIYRKCDVEKALEIKTMLALSKWKNEKQYCIKRSFQEDADAMGISKAQLSWFCIEHYKLSFLELRKRLRICEAARLMCDNPGMAMSEIRAFVGESDKSNFRKYFKKIVGCTPKEFKEILGLSQDSYRH